MLRMLQFCLKSVEDVRNVSESVESVAKLISVRKKVCLRKLTRFGGQSLVSPFLLSVPLSASLLPKKRTLFTLCNGDRSPLLSTRTNCFRRSARLNLDL